MIIQCIKQNLFLFWIKTEAVEIQKDKSYAAQTKIVGRLAVFLQIQTMFEKDNCHNIIICHSITGLS